MSVFLTDLIKFLFPGLSFIIIILVVGVDIPLFWLFTILCILSILPFTYLATFILKKESVARNVIRIIHIFAGGAMAPIVFGFMQGGKGLRITGHILRWAFVWNPTFTFSNGLITILIGTIQDPNESGYRLFTFEKALGDLIFSCAQFFFFFLMIMLIENRFYVNRIGRAVRMLDYMAVPGNDVENNAPLIMDQDVQEEEHRVASLQPSELEVRTYLLNKVYQEGGTRKHAVKDVSFGISFGE